MKPVYYKASLDSYSVVGTIVVIILTILVSYWLIEMITPYTGRGLIINNYVVIGVLIAVNIFGYLYWVRGYTLTGDRLVIHRSLFRKTINYTDIRVASEFSNNNLMRLVGNGGYLGYTGLYYSKGSGRINMCATHKKNLIIITLKNNKNFIISPDDKSLLDELTLRLAATKA